MPTMSTETTGAANRRTDVVIDADGAASAKETARAAAAIYRNGCAPPGMR